MEDDIQYGFRNILSAEEPIRLMNSYRGMPVITSATLLRLEEGQVTLRAPSIQINCMRINGNTLLTSNLLPYSLKARVVSWSLYDETVLLDSFQRAGADVSKRSFVRVEPQESIPVTLTYEESGAVIPAHLTEVSLRGIGVLVSQDSFDLKIIGKETRVNMSLDLPLKEEGQEIGWVSITCKGVMKNFEPFKKAHRLGMQIYPTMEAERALTRYIAQRQIELLSELRGMSQGSPIA